MSRLQDSRKLTSTTAPGTVWFIPVLYSMSVENGRTIVLLADRVILSFTWRKWRSPTMAIFFSVGANTYMRAGEMASILDNVVAKVFLTLPGPPSVLPQQFGPDFIMMWWVIGYLWHAFTYPSLYLPEKLKTWYCSGLQYYILFWDGCYSLLFLIKKHYTKHRNETWS